MGKEKEKTGGGGREGEEERRGLSLAFQIHNVVIELK